VDGGTVTLALPVAPKGVFLPYAGGNPGDEQVRDLVYSGLLRLDERLEPVCDLCEGYSISADNKTVTFTLRKGVTWHDGKPFTAADVAFTFRLLLHPAFDGMVAHRLAALKGVQALLDDRDKVARQVAAGTITAAEGGTRRLAAWTAWQQGPGKEAISPGADDMTVSFGLSAPYGPFLAELTQPILPRHLLGEVNPFTLRGGSGGQTATSPVGTGPYKVAEFKPSEFVRLERHDGYHLGKPHIPTVVMRVVKPGAVVDGLKGGTLDWAPVPTATVSSLQGVQGIQVQERPVPGYQYLGLNQSLPLFADVQVRQAILYALDRPGMVEQLLQGHGTVVNSHMVPGLWAHDPQGLETYAHDAKKASDLLTQAGWAEKNAEGYLTRSGKVFTFTLKYPEGNRLREASAPLIQAALKQVGIQVRLEKVDFHQLVKEVFAERKADAWLLGWDLAIDPDPGPQLRPDNMWGKASGWANVRAEALLQQGLGLMAPGDRRQIYGEWDRIVNSELPFVFLYAENEVEAVREQRVKGLKPGARGLLWNIHEWWIPKQFQQQ
jgi:peptide/nickel transport system substrate-binding protein